MAEQGDPAGAPSDDEGLHAVLQRMGNSVEISVEAALQTLLRLLGQEGFSFDALHSLIDVSDSKVWNALLRSAAHPQPPGAAAADQSSIRRLQNAVGTAFTATTRGAGDAARRSALLEGLKNDDAEVRTLAAELLGLRGEPESLAPLAALLQDRNDGVRAAAVRALGNLPTPEVIPYLLRSLERFDVVAAEAVVALVRTGRPAVVPLIGELASESDWTRWHAAKALGGIGDPEAADPLVACLTDEASNVRWEAVHALAQIGPAALAPLFHGLMTRPVTPWFAEGALRVLRRVGTGELHAVVQPVEQALRHGTAAVEAPIAAARARDVLRTLPRG